MNIYKTQAGYILIHHNGTATEYTAEQTEQIIAELVTRAVQNRPALEATEAEYGIACQKTEQLYELYSQHRDIDQTAYALLRTAEIAGINPEYIANLTKCFNDGNFNSLPGTVEAVAAAGAALAAADGDEQAAEDAVALKEIELDDQCYHNGFNGTDCPKQPCTSCEVGRARHKLLTGQELANDSTEIVVEAEQTMNEVIEIENDSEPEPVVDSLVEVYDDTDLHCEEQAESTNEAVPLHTDGLIQPVVQPAEAVTVTQTSTLTTHGVISVGSVIKKK